MTCNDDSIFPFYILTLTVDGDLKPLSPSPQWGGIKREAAEDGMNREA